MKRVFAGGGPRWFGEVREDPAGLFPFVRVNAETGEDEQVDGAVVDGVLFLSREAFAALKASEDAARAGVPR